MTTVVSTPSEYHIVDVVGLPVVGCSVIEALPVSDTDMPCARATRASNARYLRVPISPVAVSRQKKQAAKLPNTVLKH